MDCFLTAGDKIYKELEATSFLCVHELPQIIVIENNEIAIEKLRFTSQSFNSNCNNGNGFLLFIDGFTLSVIWNKAHTVIWNKAHNFLFDSLVDGSSVLLQFRSLIHVIQVSFFAVIALFNNP